MLSIFSCVSWSSIYRIWSNVCLGILPISLIRLFLFSFWVAWAVCTFWRLMSCQLLCLQIFSLTLMVVYDPEIPLLAIHPEKIIIQKDMCIPVLIAALFTIARTWTWTSLVAQMVKNLPAIRETRVHSLGWEDALEGGMAIHSSILTWRITMDRRTWQVIVHGVTKSQTWLSGKV